MQNLSSAVSYCMHVYNCSIFHTPFLMFHSRYGEYLGLLESSSSSLPHSARLERALVRTRQLLQHQQHTTKKTHLSKYIGSCSKLHDTLYFVTCYLSGKHCKGCFLSKLFNDTHMLNIVKLPSAHACLHACTCTHSLTLTSV